MTETLTAFDPDPLVGPPSALTLALLFAADPSTLDPDDATAGAIGCELGKRLLDGLQLRYLAAAAEGRRRENGDLSAPGQELAAATGLHPATSSVRTDLACSVVYRLPMTLQLLEAGVLRLKHAEDIERATRTLTDDQARHIDATAVPPGPVGLNRRIANALARLDPTLLEKKAERADAGRDVTFWTDSLDGTGGVEVLGPIEKIAQLKAAIDSRAWTKTPDDPRLLGARRFDVLFDWARQVLGLPLRGPEGNPSPTGDASTGAAGPSPTGPGGCPTCGRSGPSTIPINVTISLEALLRLSEAPGDLDGHPIPAEVARQLAGDGRWRRFVTEPHTGRLLDVGATTYRPSEALLRYVRGRHRTCIFPNCTRPATKCDCDHCRAFHTQSGLTVEANLGPLCRGHHRCKHELHWNWSFDRGYKAWWTSPAGRTYVVPPEHYGDDEHLSRYLTAISERRRARQQPQVQTEPGDMGDPPF